MLTITKNPYLCSLSKNEIQFNVKTNRFYTSEALFPSLNISIDSQPAVGSIYGLQFTNPINGNNETFSFVVVENVGFNDDLFELPVITASPDVVTFKNLFLKRLYRITELNDFYTISLIEGLDVISFVAKEPIEELLLNWSEQQSSPFLEITESRKFNNPETREGYELRAIVYFESEYNTGKWNEVADLRCVVDNDSISRIDLQSILDAEIENSWTNQPTPQEEDSFLHPYLYRYQVRFVESWTGEVQNETILSKIFKVHWGGISTDDEYMGNAIDLIGIKKDFLTFTPSGKRFPTLKNDWLGWMNTVDKAVFKLKLSFVGNGGSYSSNTYQVFELDLFETIVFNSGCTQTVLDLSVGNSVTTWSWQILNEADEPISPEFRYYEERNCIKREVIIYNSFGIPESLLLAGLEQSLTTNSQLAARSENFGLKSYFPKNFIFDSSSVKQYKAETALLTQDESTSIQTLLNATISYLVENNRFIPVTLSPGTISYYKNSEFLRFIAFDFQRANETDRVSLYPQVPTIEFYIENGEHFLSFNSVGIQIVDNPNLTVYRLGTAFGNFEWDPFKNRYFTGSGFFTAEGVYLVKGTCEDSTGTTFNLETRFELNNERLAFEFNGAGTATFRLRSYSAIDVVNTFWGDGVETISSLNNVSNTVISKTYSGSSLKKGYVEKYDLSDIYAFTSSMELKFEGLYQMDNLVQLVLSNQTAKSYYLQGFTKLQVLNIQNSPIVEIKFGMLPEISNLFLDNVGISSDQLDEMILELWKYRKTYNVSIAGGPTFSFQNLGFVPSAFFDSVINGTGDYVGEGLIPDYSISVNIS
jgi:hypothetical protein